MKTLIVNLSSLSVLSLISNNFANVEIFITSFDLVENANAEIMTTNLTNRLLSHFLINNLYICMNDDQISNDLQTDLKTFTSSDLIQIDLNVLTFVHICMKNTIIKDIDLFIYIIIDRYTSEMFYDIMIDSKASVRSIVDYEQYLAFIKNISIDLNRTKTDIVNVQFEIESIASIKSVIIDTSFEIVGFHVIKVDTSFLLSLADINRLKVYFNNVENILFMVTKNKSLLCVQKVLPISLSRLIGNLTE
jgi:hypothetical protein